ncbi:hypothetical protein AK830_g11515 [Neonectria ditissima]|uniref:Uncharacterized protein n=1 Tax=Neonectria ditissima TaxID=78410 RepID=A0A0P7AM75_9HYPO|nr:hypothetical protein AK830_g11515 [Neonectria ditissima]
MKNGDLDDNDDGGISSKSPTTLSTVNKTRHEILELAYTEYLQGKILKVSPVVLPYLELIPDWDLTVESSRDPHTDEITELECPYEKCAVFKGEAALFDRFIDFAMGLVQGQAAVGGFKAPSEIRFPPRGLEDGLTYEEFAGRVEIVEYIMWVRNVDEDDDDEEEDEKSLKLGTITDTTEITTEVTTQSSESPTSTNPTSDNTEIPENKVSEIATSPRAQTRREISSSSSSSSSLSPPPDVITTPPSLQRFTTLKRTGSESGSGESSPSGSVLEGNSPAPFKKIRR